MGQQIYRLHNSVNNYRYTRTENKYKNNKSPRKLISIMKGAAKKYGYSHSASTAAAMERIGAGDCWAMSDYLYTKMTAAHMHARIIQYPTAYSSRHERNQYNTNKMVYGSMPLYRSYGLSICSIILRATVQLLNAVNKNLLSFDVY